MLLYQIAKKMEQRAELDRTIRQSNGDVSGLVGEKTEIEQWMLDQAMKYKEADPSAFTVSGVE